MTSLPKPTLLVLVLLFLLGGCASRPINPPLTQADPRSGYRFETRQAYVRNKENLVILAFSGGGTRAAAFSYGVLEFLRRTEVVGPAGHTARLLDEVNVITGVSGGSFTALAYGLYGDKLFTDYERRFLKRNVQGEIIARTFSPRNWGNLWSLGWGRSELAAQLYDEVLFDGATFGDLDEWYTQEKLQADIQLLQAKGIHPQTLTFPGGHTWTEDFRQAAREFLRPTIA